MDELTRIILYPFCPEIKFSLGWEVPGAPKQRVPQSATQKYRTVNRSWSQYHESTQKETGKAKERREKIERMDR